MLNRDDLIGLRIAEVIVSVPDKPISMSDMSCSAGYVRLENGLVIDLGACPPLHAVEERRLRSVLRDFPTELEFRDVIGRRVVDVRFDQSLLYVILENRRMISIVPAQFWVRPSLEPIESIDEEARSIW